ncbi:BON domain-containing protein [Nitrosomonas marina]|uniref:BON domain-containing protein n=1 Tax=Nitrosomonas marina TaxID=917 RepID=A0A1H8CWQ5_9PROT|nr:BON domain-containing protein [Nitrosomonas marina]SEM99543.1 BON domain-containing protein [Nitrosomonas marina]
MIKMTVDNKLCQYRYIVGLLTIMTLLSGCAGLLNPETIESEPREDVILAMKIKSRLIESNELSAAAIHVDAKDGVVKLTGFVETSAQQALASQIAQQTDGVIQVENLLEVK